MNLINQMMSYDKSKNVNLGTSKIEKNCACEECKSVIQNENKDISIKYPSLSEEEIEQIIKEIYDYKDEKTKTFIRKSLRKHGDRYDYSNVVYTRAKDKVEIICRVEEHKPFPMKPNTHLNGHGCSKCNKNKGEESVRKFLTEKRIEFEEQKTFNGCKNKRKLKFDFYLPKYNLCIESDGNPHYRKVNWNGKMTDDEMEEKLKLNQKRDNIKNEYCKNNNIILLRVKADRVYKELSKYFQTNNIIN